VSAARRTSSFSDDDTEGTCSPFDARDTAIRVLVKRASAPAAFEPMLFKSSVTSTLLWPLESSATLPGVADDRISALSGALIGASPCENGRKRGPYGVGLDGT